MGDDTPGGIPVATSDRPGSLVSQPGQLQYGLTLMGVGTTAGWRDLVGWRDLPDANVADAEKPQAHGSVAGAVYGGSLVVTFTYLVRGTPGAKLAALATLEAGLPMDGVDRPLVVNDGDGPWLRTGRVIARNVPMDLAFAYGPLECSVQFLCADPRRYALAEHTQSLGLAVSVGGLGYPLDYPLDYGTTTGGSVTLTNTGSTPAPLDVTFVGPLTDPVLSGPGWSVGFNLTLGDGETLTVDPCTGTVLLNGDADRYYTITPASAPLERLQLAPGSTDVSLTAASGSGRVLLAYRDARL